MVEIINIAIFYIHLYNKPIKIYKMIYGYIRVSTDQQTVENQRFEIINFCRTRDIQIDGWIEENISGTKNYDKRKLGQLLANVDKGDRVICSELSRLGRELLMIMEILKVAQSTIGEVKL